MLWLANSCRLVCIHVTAASVTLDSAHYDDTVVNKAAVIVNMGAYETQGDVANCMTPVQSYETPVDTLQKVSSCFHVSLCLLVKTAIHLL